MRSLVIIFLLLNSFNLSAQTDIDTLFSGYIGNVYEKLGSDSSGNYYIAANDTMKICFWPRDKDSDFKLFDRNHSLLLKGHIGYMVCSQLVSKAGKWTSYYPTGTIKTDGYYLATNRRIGLWKHYYPNGQLEKTYTLGLFNVDSCTGICMVGTYEEYYDNGQIKVSGVYNVDCGEIDTSNVLTYDSLGNEILIKEVIKIPKSVPNGLWTYYRENGTLIKRESN